MLEGLLFTFEEFGDRGKNGFAGAGRFADFGLLVVGVEIEGLTFRNVEGAGQFRHLGWGLGDLLFALTARELFGVVEEVENLGLLGGAVAVFWHPAGVRSSGKE